MQIFLLGGLSILIDGSPIVEIPTQKTRGLLAYLAMEAGRPIRRDVIAELLWSGQPRGVARTNLRQALKNLRKWIGDDIRSSPIIHASRDTIEFASSKAYQLDVRRFQDLIGEVRSHNHASLVACEECGQNLREAIAGYQGDFLGDFYLADSREFEEWATVLREALRHQLCFALEALVDIAIEQDALEKATSYAGTLVSMDPWNEAKHRMLMRLLASTRRQSEALRQYDACRKILREEFETEPSAATVELYNQIKNGVFEGASAVEEAGTFFSRSQRDLKTWRWVPILLLGAVALAVVVSALNGRRLSGSPDPPTQSLTGTPSPFPNNEQLGEFFSFSPDNERALLEAIYYALDGDTWDRADDWITNASHCEWYGVDCFAGSVTGLLLPDNNLSGEIPAEIGSLRNLVNLDLTHNQIEGEVPEEIYNLLSLEALLLSENTWLGGEISPKIGQLRSLTDLSLSSTQFEGTIPVDIGNLSMLYTLDLANTLLTGEIPEAIGSLHQLGSIDLSRNRLSGTIPETFGQLGNLWYLAVGEGNNNLSGPLPMELINLQKLQGFVYHQTNLCEPQDIEFQDWLAGIDNLWRTGIPCP